MDSFWFALNAVAPIVIMVAIGYILKRMRFINSDFVKMANKLVFRVLLPVMLFINIYEIEALDGIELSYVWYVLIAVVALFAIAIPFVLLVTKRAGARGALVQAVFRSNFSLIGIPLADALAGKSGVAIASLLSAFATPAFNVFAVIGLATFRESGEKPSIKRIALDIAKNPLIIGVVAGVLSLVVRHFFVQNGIVWRLSDVAPLYEVIIDLSAVATPLALIVLGAQFEFSAVAALKREIIFGVVMRNIIVPILGLGVAYLFFRDTFNAAHFASFIAVFATPVAVSSVTMAQEMDGDAILAGQLVVWSTLFSTLSIFLSAFLLRWAGVF